MQNRHSSTFKFDSIVGIIMLVGFFVGLYLILKGIFTVLSTVWVSLGLLAITLVIDRKVVVNYLKWIWNTLQNRPLYGIAAVLFTVLGYMVVIPFLFAKALFKRKVKKMTRQFQGQAPTQRAEYTEYEEISSETHEEERLELPRQPQERTRPQSGKYDQFFD